MPQAAISCLLLVERAELSTFMMSKGVKTTVLLLSFDFSGKAIQTYMFSLSGTLIPLGVFVVWLL